MVMNENSKLISETQGMLEAAQEENIVQSEQIDILSAELAEALSQLKEGDLDEVVAALKNAESRLDVYEAMNEDILILNVRLENTPNNAIRYLTFGKPTDADVKPIENRSDEQFEKAVNQLKVFINETTQHFGEDNPNSDAIVYLVFSYDPNKIYQRDFRAIDQALQNFESNTSIKNFRYRTNPISEDKTT